MTIKLKRLRAGSYETQNGSHFTYTCESENGAPLYWLTYLASEDTNDVWLANTLTLAEARQVIERDIAELEYLALCGYHPGNHKSY
jgi:hypothetical protein